MKRLEGKVAIVTGAGTGLGRETAKLYAQEGAAVVLGDIREEEGERTAGEIRDAGGTALFRRTDVSSSADVRALVETAEREHGRLDVITANAGILGRGAYTSLAEIPEDEFARVIDVNFYGVVWSFKHAIPAILRAGGGAMTATASLGAHRGFSRLDAYCASKGAIVALVRSLSADLYPRIRVNAVSPGGMATEMGLHTAEDKGVANPEEVIRLSRMGNLADRPVSSPQDVARVHLFLVSDDGAFVNGQSVVADGGWGVIPA
jgi:NAD(P)-dependent dehydrogenase (short-subunit alcohol dehydrogenase family)